jgi:hypothetical protein
LTLLQLRGDLVLFEKLLHSSELLLGSQTAVYFLQGSKVMLLVRYHSLEFPW